jgi:peptide/nickel transport system permease protein
VAVAVGVPLGMLSARRENTALDHAVRLVSLFSLSIPVFWQATMLILAFSLWLQWAPPVDFVGLARDPLRNLAIIALPGLALGTAVAAVFMRMTRSSVLEVMRQDYVRTARAKGVSDRLVVYRHALGNAMIPILTVFGLEFGYNLGGAVLTETVFSLPGVGRLIVEGIFARDYPVVQGALLVVATTFVLVNLLTDVAYAYFDPRIRYS